MWCTGCARVCLRVWALCVWCVDSLPRPKVMSMLWSSLLPSRVRPFRRSTGVPISVKRRLLRPRRVVNPTMIIMAKIKPTLIGRSHLAPVLCSTLPVCPLLRNRPWRKLDSVVSRPRLWSVWSEGRYPCTHVYTRVRWYSSVRSVRVYVGMRCE